MKAEDIETLADMQQYFTENTPRPIRKWYGIRCPRCGQRFCNSLFGTWMNYEVHYMTHIHNDLMKEEK